MKRRSRACTACLGWAARQHCWAGLPASPAAAAAGRRRDARPARFTVCHSAQSNMQNRVDAWPFACLLPSQALESCSSKVVLAPWRARKHACESAAGQCHSDPSNRVSSWRRYRETADRNACCTQPCITRPVQSACAAACRQRCRALERNALARCSGHLEPPASCSLGAAARLLCGVASCLGSRRPQGSRRPPTPCTYFRQS